MASACHRIASRISQSSFRAAVRTQSPAKSPSSPFPLPSKSTAPSVRRFSLARYLRLSSHFSSFLLLLCVNFVVRLFQFLVFYVLALLLGLRRSWDACSLYCRFTTRLLEREWFRVWAPIRGVAVRFLRVLSAAPLPASNMKYCTFFWSVSSFFMHYLTFSFLALRLSVSVLVLVFANSCCLVIGASLCKILWTVYEVSTIFRVHTFDIFFSFLLRLSGAILVLKFRILDCYLSFGRLLINLLKRWKAKLECLS